VKDGKSLFSSLTAHEFPNSWLSPLFSARQSEAILQSFGPKSFKISELEAIPREVKFSIVLLIFSVFSSVTHG
jgi:hypothetical protein